MKVTLLGATGLTGAKVLEGLLARDDVSSVIVPVRRPLSLSHAKLEQHEVNFDHLDEYASLFDVDAIICCLGTTIKKAGSAEAFRKVDYGYGMKVAALGRAKGVKRFILMSAIAASPSSRVFYNRVKGELEESVKALCFPYLSIYQPSLLLGERAEQRTVEALGMKAMPLINRALIGPLERFRAIEADTVARAMVNEVGNLHTETSEIPLVRIHDYPDIVMLAQKNPGAKPRDS
ncbi:MAG: NAD-dependent epimerase/dehydratase family protein [Marinobacter sp.]